MARVTTEAPYNVSNSYIFNSYYVLYGNVCVVWFLKVVDVDSVILYS